MRGKINYRIRRPNLEEKGRNQRQDERRRRLPLAHCEGGERADRQGNERAMSVISKDSDRVACFASAFLPLRS